VAVLFSLHFSLLSYHWPDIDVDLSEEVIENPADFPLQAKMNS
jgi:hypothetical protein